MRFNFRLRLILTIFISSISNGSSISSFDYWRLVDPNPIYANHYFARELFRYFDETNVSDLCRSTAAYVGDNQYEEFAVKFIDSSGAVPAGVARGNLQFLGDYDECLDIVFEPTLPAFDGKVYGQYCTLAVPIASIISADNFAVINFTQISAYTISVGICLPSTCTQTDVNQIMELYSTKTNLTVNAASCTDQTEIRIKWYHILIFSSFSALFLIIIIGTVVDTNSDNISQTEKSSQPCKPSSVRALLISFSARKNTLTLFHTGGQRGQTIACFNGFRLISILFIILYHSYTEAQIPSANLFDIFRGQRNFLLQIVTNAGLWVEAFFLLSGFLCAYGTIRELSGGSTAERAGRRYNAVKAFAHRYLRLTPSLVGIIAFSVLQEVMSSGPLWYQYVDTSVQSCHKNWWTNLLYVNNIVGLNQLGEPPTECLPFTWYLAVDMQLFLVSPLLIILLANQNTKYQYTGIALNIVVIIVSWIITGIIIANHGLTPTVLINIYDLDYINRVYKQSYCRIGPYCVGILMAYAYLKLKDSIIIRPTINLICWSSAIALNLGITFLTWPWITGLDYHNFASVLYGAVHRTLWSASWAYILFACATGHGGLINRVLGWSALVPISRLTYQAYLFHTVIVSRFVYEARQPVYSSPLNLVTMFFQYTCLSFVVSYVAYIALEAPIVNIERIVFQRTARDPDRISDAVNNNDTGNASGNEIAKDN